jgi:hypothetical protein
MDMFEVLSLIAVYGYLGERERKEWERVNGSA